MWEIFKKHTMRNFLKSFPAATLRKPANALLISTHSAEATCRTSFSGRWTSGMRGGLLQNIGKKITTTQPLICWYTSQSTKTHEREYYYLLMRVQALDQRNKSAAASIKMWHTRVSRWYSINSKRTHIAVTNPSTPAETFLFLHRNTSAAAQQIYHKIHTVIFFPFNFHTAKEKDSDD
jgi:hypothetical protein